MVILGGLEIVAGAYLINKHVKNKRERQRLEEERQRLEEEQYHIFPPRERPHRHHRSHSERPQSRDRRDRHGSRESRRRDSDERRSRKEDRPASMSPAPSYYKPQNIPSRPLVQQPYIPPPHSQHIPHVAPATQSTQQPHAPQPYPQDIKYGWTEDGSSASSQSQQQGFPPTGWPAHWDQTQRPENLNDGPGRTRSRSDCSTKGKACLYTQSRRGGSRIRKKRGEPSSRDLKAATVLDNNDFNQVSLSILPELHQADFAEPLSLVLPGGGLKQLKTKTFKYWYPGMAKSAEMPAFEYIDTRALQPMTTHLEDLAVFFRIKALLLTSYPPSRLDLCLDDTDFIFDAIFNGQSEDSGYNTSEHTGSLENEQAYTFIRTYSSTQDILGAYYVYIHPYFPVLLPPEPQQVYDDPDLGTRNGPDAVFHSRSNPCFEPTTPLSLAISATLALIPHPDDPDPSGQDSIYLRRDQAQAFAQAAFESIEIESELIDSMIQPSEALSSTPNLPNREPFHPQCPLENESIIALLLLSSYEYAQRGNISKMRNRAGQALSAAMGLNLHSRLTHQGNIAEANSRVWWMTYIAVCQGSILSNSPPPVLLHDPRFITQGPSFRADRESWAIFLQAQQVIVSATLFVIDLDSTMKNGSEPSSIWQRMLELESLIEPLVLKADTWVLESSPAVTLDLAELKVSQALRGMAKIKLNSARIKLHRYCAFLDIPIFTKKHCDLRPASPITATQQIESCPCSSTFHQLGSPSSISSSVASPAVPCGILPFSSHFSAKVCLKSAFAIARSFASLPYPEPIRPNDPLAFLMPFTENEKTPRMIPVFACCAMQSSYAMIMLSYKTRAMGFAGLDGVGGEQHVERLLGQLQEGLELVLNALRNYSIAYEALGGMRDQIELAVQSLKTLDINDSFE
ncbi:hypothetical protein GLAREA_03779 [Glarea lozoyensis ATCC 20868]|uniref:Transcription factor domain-containing protein n=2 Tax=Glarea lozoyensis TaxID=101852 RepID=S3CWU7_GLAL2|nr:uncharacterized protein GLAREA_03779 [Glarea lozoyensis ATCC 20868]EPE30812.1 hypothetical protein GLAREA_03779 [Glarea lozoyensis ATCC 20868]